MTYSCVNFGQSSLSLVSHRGKPIHVTFHNLAQFLRYFVHSLFGETQNFLQLSLVRSIVGG